VSSAYGVGTNPRGGQQAGGFTDDGCARHCRRSSRERKDHPPIPGRKLEAGSGFPSRRFWKETETAQKASGTPAPDLVPDPSGDCQKSDRCGVPRFVIRSGAEDSTCQIGRPGDVHSAVLCLGWRGAGWTGMKLTRKYLGERELAYVFCMRSMASGGASIAPSRHASQQAFSGSARTGVRFISGVFKTLRYDNLKSAVKRFCEDTSERRPRDSSPSDRTGVRVGVLYTGRRATRREVSKEKAVIFAGTTWVPAKVGSWEELNALLLEASRTMNSA